MPSIIVVLLGAASYGLLSTFVKLAYQAGFTPGEVIGSQATLGFALMLAVWAAFRLRKGKQASSRAGLRVWLSLIPVGAANALTSVFYYMALQEIPASLAVVLLFQFTWIGVLIESAITRRKPGYEKVLALIVVGAGTILAGGLADGGWNRFTWAGLAFGLLSAVTYSLVIVLSGKMAVEVHPIPRSAVMLFFSMAVTLTVFPPTYLTGGALSHGLLGWGLLLALFGYVIPPLLFAIGVPKTGGTLASILSSAELPVAVLMSRLALGETVTLAQWAGVLTILAGIALPEWLHRKFAKQLGRS
ncbi:EamA family transporter [Cohnella caldifontis]|uniref:EamA family transporter n=1 Tax=Cohnella caldifontis TaxID=3027471 RepID=UPI0023EE23DD|nr:DMT family transporter [Cohnella sp. YIM B05605]